MVHASFKLLSVLLDAASLLQLEQTVHLNLKFLWSKLFFDCCSETWPCQPRVRLTVRLQPHSRQSLHVQGRGSDPTVLRHLVQLKVRSTTLQPDTGGVAIKPWEIMLGWFGVVFAGTVRLWWRQCSGRQQRWSMIDQPREWKLRRAFSIKWQRRWWWMVVHDGWCRRRVGG